jgi:hypothetical protein
MYGGVSYGLPNTTADKTNTDLCWRVARALSLEAILSASSEDMICSGSDAILRAFFLIDYYHHIHEF